MVLILFSFCSNRFSKRPLRGPYGQMLEAEMKKPSKTNYDGLLEQLNRSERWVADYRQLELPINYYFFCVHFLAVQVAVLFVIAIPACNHWTIPTVHVCRCIETAARRAVIAVVMHRWLPVHQTASSTAVCHYRFTRVPLRVRCKRIVALPNWRCNTNVSQAASKAVAPNIINPTRACEKSIRKNSHWTTATRVAAPAMIDSRNVPRLRRLRNLISEIHHRQPLFHCWHSQTNDATCHHAAKVWPNKKQAWKQRLSYWPNCWKDRAKNWPNRRETKAAIAVRALVMLCQRLCLDVWWVLNDFFSVIIIIRRWALELNLIKSSTISRKHICACYFKRCDSTALRF